MKNVDKKQLIKNMHKLDGKLSTLAFPIESNSNAYYDLMDDIIEEYRIVVDEIEHILEQEQSFAINYS